MFTTPCYIEKNVPYLIKELERIGYRKLSILGDYNDLRYFDKYIATLSSGIIVLNNNNVDINSYNCENNEELFLAIAALRGDTDKHQWFTDGYHWELCPTDVAYIPAWIDRYDDTPHKATLSELIEHFKEKE